MSRSCWCNDEVCNCQVVMARLQPTPEMLAHAREHENDPVETWTLDDPNWIQRALDDLAAAEPPVG